MSREPLSVRSRSIVGVWLLFLLPGCGPMLIQVNVDSIATPAAASHGKYVVLSGNKSRPDSDLEFRLVARMVDAVLRRQGFDRTSNEAAADLAIFLDFGISEPHRESVPYQVPIYGQTGGGTVYHSGNVQAYSPRGGSAYGTYSGQSYAPPQYGVTGYASGVRTYTYFTRWLAMDAVSMAKLRSGNQVDPIWKTTLTSTGSSGDLRPVIAHMLAAAEEQIGTNTAGNVRHTIPIGAKRAKELQAEMIDSAP